jgi:hypothetical protein
VRYLSFVVQLALCMDEGGGCENSEWLGFIVGRVLDMGVEELGASRRERGGFGERRRVWSLGRELRSRKAILSLPEVYLSAL